MPVIKSAIKRARQAKPRTERNRQTLSRMRTLVKNVLLWTKAGEKEKAESFFPDAQKAVDMAAKKNLIHKNNAARRKASLAAAMKKAEMSTAAKAKAEKPSTKAVSEKKKPAAKKKTK